MTTHARGLSCLLLGALGALLLVETASAAPVRPLKVRPEYRPDGSVRFGSKVFPTRSAYFRSSAFRESGARCGSTEVSPLAAIAPTDCSYTHTTINPEYNDNRVLVIQVVFHVMKRTNGQGDVPMARIQEQMDILNQDFQALTGTPGAMGFDSKIEFVLAAFDPQGAPTTGVNVVTNDDYFQDPGGGFNNMKQALNWDPTRYLNIYTNDAAGYLGYATFPMEEAGGPEDGVVLYWEAVGNSTFEPYNLGRTATHEVGHYLGLFHTFQDRCGSGGSQYDTGDLIADTNADYEPHYECTPVTTCGLPAPIENYMEYTDDACMTKFTAEQSNRMRCSMFNYRTLNTKPTAAFTASASLLAVTFTNTSTDAESAPDVMHHAWDFGDGQMSTELSPVHTYTTAGTYNVTLVVTDPGSGRATATESVVVTATATPDADPGGGDDDDDGGGGRRGGCQTSGGEASFLLLALPVGLLLRRRRRA